jgi:2-polyprenyl-3-methyl-5-hydroxy-6-metoxy-1,4-benzoquinol methylase
MPSVHVKERVREPELMDQPGLDPGMHRQALVGLRRVNRISGTVGRLWRPIRQLAAERPRRPIRVLDVASGGGDVAAGIARQARQANLAVVVDGCDVSPVAIEHAGEQAQSAGLDNVRFFALDVLQDRLPETYDVVTCSLFLHHLETPEATQVLQRMAAATRHLVLVDDLRRTSLGYALAWLGCRMLTRSSIVHTDGPRSVAAAFTTDEAAALARQAGLNRFTLTPHWPERFLLSWRKP